MTTVGTDAHWQVLQLLLQAKANAALKDEATGDYALHTCIVKKFWGAIPLLIDHGAVVNQLDAGMCLQLLFVGSVLVCKAVRSHSKWPSSEVHSWMISTGVKDMRV